MNKNNNYNTFHIISEAVVMGGISVFFYKKISELESTISDLQSQISTQNNQIKLLIQHLQNVTTPLKIPTPPPTPVRLQNSMKPENCENGVCKLVPKKDDKKVSISKISKQIEFDRENMENSTSSKIKTFESFSPNPVLKSVTPKSSIDTNLEKILDEIDQE